MGRLVLAVFVSLAACAAEAAPSAPQPMAVERVVPPPAPPPPVPTEVLVHVHLPGPVEGRHANLTLETGAAPWRIVGCVAATPGACRATQAVDLGPADEAVVRERWDALFAEVRCEPEGPQPGDRPFEVEADGAVWSGSLPADPKDVPARLDGPCRAPARLAWWAAERFRVGTSGAARASSL